MKTETILPEVQSMLDNPGWYLCGDTNRPEYTVPIYSDSGKLYTLALDSPLTPHGFFDTLTVAGPFFKKDLPPPKR